MSDVYVNPAQGEALVFKFGDGADPEEFTSGCSINTDRSIEFSNDIYTATIANCTDPSKPAKTVRRVKSKDLKFTGSGMTDIESFKRLLQLKESASVFNGQLLQDVTNGFLITGPWVIESIKTGGTAREEQTFDIAISIAGDYDLTWP